MNYTPLNFFGIIFCMMVGTASLPHILMRYFTTPSVKEARDSVAWSLLFYLPPLLLGAGLCGVLEAGGVHQHHRQGLERHPSMAVPVGRTWTDPDLRQECRKSRRGSRRL